VTRPPLTSPFAIGPVEVSNRVLLAPLAGIGNWFVRLQARRHGAGLVFSEMVSSFAVHHRNRRTRDELLHIHPDEHPVAIQLFGFDPHVMRSAAATVAETGPDLIDINMGCPVPKVCKSGAGAALLRDPDRAVELARAAREGSGLPVTVKLRSGMDVGDHSGLALAERLASEANVSAIAFHPRAAAVHHKGAPDYGLVRELTQRVDVPVIVSGGLASAELAQCAYEESSAEAVMIARGALGDPWIFERLTGRRTRPVDEAQVLAELDWVLERGECHWGPERAARNLRKFYPWYLDRLGVTGAEAHAYQRAESVAQVRRMLTQLAPSALVA
jgi:nifR3 family TIM-barrel protein